MTAAAKPLTGASSAAAQWNTIDWRNTEAEVHRLQIRIAKAIREGRHGKAKALQWLLTHSLHAKLLAVKRVVQNKGGKTPGVDKVVWRTPLGSNAQWVREGSTQCSQQTHVCGETRKHWFLEDCLPVMGGSYSTSTAAI
jgi:hypothetical protein